MLDDRFERLLREAQQGDGDAFAELWRSTQPMLVRYLRVVAGDEADDVASQTWLRVMESLTSFEGSGPQFRRWVVTIARNLHLDLVRRRGRRPESAVDDLSELDASSVPDAGHLVEERMSTESALRLIASLPEAQAEMVMLRVVLGMEVAEVAQVVGKRPGTVRVAVHRALRTLEERLSRPAERADVTPTWFTTFSEHDA
ncbi:RNA polymerase sigma factor [Nocardioides sp.]|uniref:RNA polymerase sigma factor n=1 Tax=Nocardioides sp. TaxID=35761 RepID=UPI00352819D8